MPDFRIYIDVKNVATGDIKMLCEDILNDHGDNFDAARGEFIIRTYTREGQSGETFFQYDWEDEWEDEDE